MSRGRRILVAVVAAAALIAAAFGLSAWRRAVNAGRPSPKAPSSSAPPSGALPAPLADAAARTATGFETNARQWGVGRFDLGQAQAMPIGQAITRWRVADDGGLPARRAALEPLVGGSVTLHDPQERDPSWAGTDLYSGYADYWAKQLYTIGVNIEPDGLRVVRAGRSSDGTIDVRVSVRQQVVVYTPPAADQMPEGSWTFSPSIGYYQCEDHLRLSRDGARVVQLPDGGMSGPWFLSPLVHGWKKADSGFTGLTGAEQRHDQSVTYQGDGFRGVHAGLYPDPLFMGSGATAQQPAPEGAGRLAPGQLPPVG